MQQSCRPSNDPATPSAAKTALDVSTSSSSASTSGDPPLDWEHDDDDDGDNHDDFTDELRRQHELLAANVSELLAQTLACRHGDNNAAERGLHDTEDPEDAPAARERLLRAKLAHALVELAAKQTDLQLAARAGKELLEKLHDAKVDAAALRESLYTCEQQMASTTAENARLVERHQLLEHELLQLRESSRDTTAAHDSLDYDERDGGCALGAANEVRGDCRRCLQLNTEMTVALHENNELKRRCLELERQQGARQLELEQLERQREALRSACDNLQLRYDTALQDLDDIRFEHAQLRADHQEVLAARDHLRVTTRRLRSEKDALESKLDARETRVAILESGRRTAGTHTQVLENRAARLQANNEELLQVLAKVQEQAKCESEQQQQVPSDYYDDAPQSDGGSISLQQHARDLECLLDEAQQSLAALKLENRALRRRQMQQHRHLANGSVVDVPLRRTKSMDMTCADILAADEALHAEQEAFSRQRLAGEREIVREPTAEADAEADVAQPSDPPNSHLLRLFAASRRRRMFAVSACKDKFSLQDQHDQHPHRTTSIDGSEDNALEDMVHDGDAHMDKAPLYLGLSVIACATAAAGLLSRR